MLTLARVHRGGEGKSTRITPPLWVATSYALLFECGLPLVRVSFVEPLPRARCAAASFQLLFPRSSTIAHAPHVDGHNDHDGIVLPALLTCDVSLCQQETLRPIVLLLHAVLGCCWPFYRTESPVRYILFPGARINMDSSAIVNVKSNCVNRGIAVGETIIVGKVIEKRRNMRGTYVVSSLPLSSRRVSGQSSTKVRDD